MFKPRLKLKDAQQLSIGFVRNQSHVLNATAYEIEYPEMDYAALVPVNTNLPEWVSGQDTMIMDKVGAAKWQSAFAKDIPMADVTLDMVSTTFAMYAVGYQWNIEELGKAAYNGFPLSARRAEAARFASEIFIWEVALIGSAQKNWTGLTNSSYVTPTALPADGTDSTSAWVLNTGAGNKTNQKIVRDVNLLIGGPVVAGSTILTSILADTLLLPQLAYRYLTDTQYGAEVPNTSLLQYVQANNLYTVRTGRPLTIRELPALDTAATTTIVGGGRAIAYKNSADVLELGMPMPYQFLDVYQDGPLNWTVPGIGRIGQVDVKKPKAIRYGDAVTPVPA